MIKKWFVRYADTNKSVEVSKEEYSTIENMAKFYNAYVSDNFGIGHRSKTLRVSFNQHFV